MNRRGLTHRQESQPVFLNWGMMCGAGAGGNSSVTSISDKINESK